MPNRRLFPLTALSVYLPKSCQYHASRSISSYSPPVPIRLPALSPHWVPALKERVGKCIMFGLQPAQIDEVASIMSLLTQHWRELIAGSEGFLVGGPEDHAVAWGELIMIARVVQGSTVSAMVPNSIVSHLNNVAFIRLADSARVNWIQNYAANIDTVHKKQWLDLLTSESEGLMLRSIKTEYKFGFPMTWPDKISVHHRLRSAPTVSSDSFILDVLILSERHQRVAARCVEDLLMYDYQQERSTGLKSFMVKAFQDTWMAQEEQKAKNEIRARELMSRVQRLETASWRRQGAKEDMGNA